MIDRLDDYDWACMFEFAGEVTHHHNDVSISRCEGDEGCSIEEFTREDVIAIVASDDGMNDEADWLGVFKLPGRFAVIVGGCDYTGWD